MFFPFWFRLAQSLRRYRDNKFQFNLVNAAKYISIMIMASLYVAYDIHRTNTLLAVYLIYGLFNTVFCLGWDFYMDWGLFRSKDGGKRFLRPKILFPPWFYYFGLLSNTILRLFWLLQVVPWTEWAADPQFMLTVLGVAEGFRRMQWTLMRIENENVNNFERYRNILQIPAFKEEYEGDEQK